MTGLKQIRQRTLQVSSFQNPPSEVRGFFLPKNERKKMDTYLPSEYPQHLSEKIARAREIIKKRKEDPKWQQLCAAVQRWSDTQEGKEIARRFIWRYLAAEIAKTKIAEKHYEKTR